MPSYAHRKVASYRHVQQATTTPGQRLVMCYDAVIRDLEKAIAAFDDPSPSRNVEVHNALDHASQIVHELQLALDRSAAPELCASLDDLYGFWMREFSEANANKTPAGLPPIIEMIRELRDTWHQAARAASGGI